MLELSCADDRESSILVGHLLEESSPSKTPPHLLILNHGYY